LREINADLKKKKKEVSWFLLRFSAGGSPKKKLTDTYQRSLRSLSCVKLALGRSLSAISLFVVLEIMLDFLNGSSLRRPEPYNLIIQFLLSSMDRTKVETRNRLAANVNSESRE
jgi:hypothetical protein